MQLYESELPSNAVAAAETSAGYVFVSQVSSDCHVR